MAIAAPAPVPAVAESPPIAAPAREEHTDAARVEALLTELRALPETKSENALDSAFFDMHGNANRTLVALMAARFDATPLILKELAALDSKKLPAHAAALYRVLRTVRDPAAIPWLDHRFEGPGASDLFTYWLAPSNRPYLYEEGVSSARWLEKPDEWAAFYRRRYAKETKPAPRLALLSALQGHFHDPQTVALFQELDRSPAIKGELRLLVEVFLRQHGLALDRILLLETIAELRKTEDGTRTMRLYALAIRDEAFVPWLVSTVKPPQPHQTVIYSDAVPEAHEILQRATFRLDVTSPAAWRAWWTNHGRDGRERWARDAVEEFQALLAKDPGAAKRFLKQAVHRWNDPLLIPFVAELSAHQELHDDLVGWVNLTCSTEPHWRPQLEPIARKIVEQSGATLAPWAKGLLVDLEFLPGAGPLTWEQHVQQLNSRL